MYKKRYYKFYIIIKYSYYSYMAINYKKGDKVCTSNSSYIQNVAGTPLFPLLPATPFYLVLCKPINIIACILSLVIQ